MPATEQKSHFENTKGSFDPNSYSARAVEKEIKKTDWEKSDEGLEMLITEHLDAQYRDNLDNYFYSGLIKYNRKEILVKIDDKNMENKEVIASARHDEDCKDPEITFYKEGLREALHHAKRYYNIEPRDFVNFIFFHEISHIKNEDSCSKRTHEEKEEAADRFALEKMKESGASPDTVMGLCQFYGRCLDPRRISGIKFSIR